METFDMFIKENKESFDSVEPEKGHLKRFEQKLRSSESHRWFLTMRIAAAAFFAVAIFGSVLVFLTGTKTEKVISKLDPEYQKAIYFYDSQNDKLLKEIESMDISNQDVKNEIIKDIEEYDNNYIKIVGDLKKYPDNQRVINALIEYHRSKTEMLSFVFGQLQLSKNVNR